MQKNNLFLFFTISLFAYNLTPSPETTLLLNSYANEGLWSHFTLVLGALSYAEQHRCFIKPHFTKGYYCNTPDDNWWEYYFEPFAHSSSNSVYSIIERSEQNVFFNRAKNNSYDHNYALIKKYIAIKPEIIQHIEHFKKQHDYEHTLIIGVHYRGTDYCCAITYEHVFSAVRTLLKQLNPPHYKLFVATDEASFLAAMQQEFEQVIYYACTRSHNEQPLHKVNTDPRQIGTESIIDCLLLSASNYLIVTPSTLNFATRCFNPSLWCWNLAQDQHMPDLPQKRVKCHNYVSAFLRHKKSI